MGSGSMELTKNELNANVYSAGRASYGRPVPLWDNATGEVASFSSNLTFRIRPQNETGRFRLCDFNGSAGMGAGMAFFLARYPSRIPLNSYGMNLALFNDSNNFNVAGDDRLVAVEFDTYLNPKDHSNNHVGIDARQLHRLQGLHKRDEAPGLRRRRRDCRGQLRQPYARSGRAPPDQRRRAVVHGEHVGGHEEGLAPAGCRRPLRCKSYLHRPASGVVLVV